MKTMIQVSFYPTGRVDYIYSDGTVTTKQFEVTADTPAQALQKRLERTKAEKLQKEKKLERYAR